MEIYLVGGAVRDQLLNRPVVEQDWVVVGATPEQLIERGYKPVGKDFPVFLHPESHDEYALARTERKTGQGYHGFDCYFAPDVTLEEDLARRDLTINAMAQSADGEIIDPYNGLADLKARQLRHVSSAFVEDPLRVLRVARFAARYHYLGFSIASETLALMRQLASGTELQALTPERVWKETEKALTEQSPQVYFEQLHAVGALAVIFPEIDKLWGIPSSSQSASRMDAGLHAMSVLQQAAQLSESTLVRFAALCHDIGNDASQLHARANPQAQESPGVTTIKKMAKRLKIPNQFRKIACITREFYAICHRAFELTPEQLIATLESLGAYRQPEQLQQFLLASEAEFRGHTGSTKKPYPQRQLLSSIALATASIDSQPLLQAGLKGAEIGDAIREQRIEIAADIKSKLTTVHTQTQD